MSRVCPALDSLDKMVMKTLQQLGHMHLGALRSSKTGSALMHKAYPDLYSLDYRSQEGTLLPKAYPVDGYPDQKG